MYVKGIQNPVSLYVGGTLPEWKREYFNSCNKFIMAETLSPTFVGMDFSEVAEICYTKLNLLLLAMEARKYEGGDIYINPQNKVINPNAIGKQTLIQSYYTGR